MSRIVIFEPATNRCTRFLASADTPKYTSDPTALIEPPGLDATLAESGDLRTWRHDAGAVRIETTQERADREAEEAAALDAALRSTARALYDGQQEQGQALRALVKVMLSEINTLRALHGLADRTLAQAKSAIQSQIDAGGVDE